MLYAGKGGYCHHHSNYTRTTANKAKMSLKVSAKGFRPDLENKTDQSVTTKVWIGHQTQIAPRNKVRRNN